MIIHPKVKKVLDIAEIIIQTIKAATDKPVKPKQIKRKEKP